MQLETERECGTNPIEPSSGTEPLPALTEVMQVALCNPGTVGSRRCSASCSCELQIPARAQGKGLQSFTSASNKRQMGTATAHGRSNVSVKAGLPQTASQSPLFQNISLKKWHGRVLLLEQPQLVYAIYKSMNLPRLINTAG